MMPAYFSRLPTIHTYKQTPVVVLVSMSRTQLLLQIIEGTLDIGEAVFDIPFGGRLCNQVTQMRTMLTGTVNQRVFFFSLLVHNLT